MIVILFSYTTIQLKYIHKQQHQLLLLLQVHQQIAATSTRTTRKKKAAAQNTDLCTKNVINMKIIKNKKGTYTICYYTLQINNGTYNQPKD